MIFYPPFWNSVPIGVLFRAEQGGLGVFTGYSAEQFSKNRSEYSLSFRKAVH
jgi:hypothetical protein